MKPGAFKMLSLALACAVSTPAATQDMPPMETHAPGPDSGAPGLPYSFEPPRERPTKEGAELSRAREVMRQFAQCVVKAPKRRLQATAVVLSDIPNVEIIQAHSRLIDPDCLPYRDNTASMKLSLPGDYFRYALAEALVIAEIPQPLADLKTVPPLQRRAHDPSKFLPKPGKKQSRRYLESLEKLRIEDQVEIFASKFGECVVREDPLNSHRLLRTEPSSAEEGAVLQLLQPSLANCLTKGQTIKIARSMVRGTVAVNYYRLAQAVRTMPSRGSTP